MYYSVVSNTQKGEHSMKKKLTLIVAAILVFVMAFAMTACGGGNSGGGGGKGESLNVGDFTISVPSGWKNFESTDMFEKDENGNSKVKTDQVYIVKGGESEFDVFTKPCVTVTYYVDQTAESQKEPLSWFVDEITELEYTANGTACVAFETKTESILEEGKMDTAYYIFLPVGEGSAQFTFSGDELKLDDKDVKAMVESFKLN